MKLERIVIREGPEEYESLALALRATAAAEGEELDYDDLCATLGVSFAAVSTLTESAPGWWTTFGRDAFLEPAAKLFGFELRDLHPPDVAVDMLSAEEFAQHWLLSYKPLIRAALDNQQPVLAWQGWPEFRWPFWGVITATADEDFDGTTMWSQGERQRLSEPALQCYVVERYEPRFPPASELFAAAMKHADAYMNRAPFTSVVPGAPPPRIITGPAAIDRWGHWLQYDEVRESADGPAWNDHRQNAEFIACARLSAARFLQRMQPVIGPERRNVLESAIECCQSIAQWLGESRNEEMVRSLFTSRQGRERLLSSLNAAEAADRRLAACVEELRAEV